ncbi:snaclec trimecetin subunit beta-like [Patiria miniata]|uniref:C-type lectin domain-containing protein n=1 Tax=Patiria miniata TaxID=46514 RepID=A0A913Z995_PATMI|nr:snaclec trimecetin subunit beta-like [Patiria miniata]
MASIFDSLILLMFVWGGLSTLSALCPPGWKNWHQSCYAIYFDRISWVDASKSCDGKHSHLVVPNSQAENDFLWRMVMERYETAEERGVLIGCKRESADSSFECTGNTEGMSFTNWATGFPEQGARQCVVLSKGGNGTWKSYGCELRKYVVCAMPDAPRVHCLAADANGRFVTDLP